MIEPFISAPIAATARQFHHLYRSSHAADKREKVRALNLKCVVNELDHGRIVDRVG